MAGERMRARGAHAVVVTHSADFLAEEGGAFLVYVERGAHETLYRPVRFRDRAGHRPDRRGDGLRPRRAADPRADRPLRGGSDGPGRHRRALRPRARAPRIALGVFGGVANVKDVLDHPVVRYTAAHIAVLVDAVPLEDARRIRDDANCAAR